MTFCSTVGFICIRVLGLVKSHNMSAADYMQRVFPIGARGVPGGGSHARGRKPLLLRQLARPAAVGAQTGLPGGC